MQHGTDEDGSQYAHKAAGNSQYQIQLLFQIIALGEKDSTMPQKPAENESREKLTIKILFRNLENPINQNVGQPETAETKDSAFLHKVLFPFITGGVFRAATGENLIFIHLDSS